jgi:hypothetical protein
MIDPLLQMGFGLSEALGALRAATRQHQGQVAGPEIVDTALTLLMAFPTLPGNVCRCNTIVIDEVLKNLQLHAVPLLLMNTDVGYAGKEARWMERQVLECWLRGAGRGAIVFLEGAVSGVCMHP